MLIAEAAELKREAKAAVADERSRIARELHDIISHTVSVIGLQAGAAERMLDRDPERARQPLQSIQERARESVLELRRLFGILRDGEERAELTPQPRLAQLGLLLETGARSRARHRPPRRRRSAAVAARRGALRVSNCAGGAHKRA